MNLYAAYFAPNGTDPSGTQAGSYPSTWSVHLYITPTWRYNETTRTWYLLPVWMVHQADSTEATSPRKLRDRPWFSWDKNHGLSLRKLGESDDALEMEEIRRQTYTGRPLGAERFVRKLERAAGKVLHRLSPGRPKERKAKRRK